MYCLIYIFSDFIVDVLIFKIKISEFCLILKKSVNLPYPPSSIPTVPGYCISGFLCRAFLRGCAEILVVGEIFTSGASEPPRSKKNQIIEGQ